jgi:hypothetical protein
MEYTGKIHHCPSTVSAVFLNTAKGEETLCDERTAADYIELVQSETKQQYIQALKDIQGYKIKNKIDTDLLPYETWR